MASLVTTNRMQHCFNVFIDINHEFLLLFYCCFLLEIKLTTITTTISYRPSICYCFPFREDLHPSQGSRASITSTLPDLDRSVELIRSMNRSTSRSMDRSMDMDDASLGSLAEYGDFEEGKFNEDGSFIGRYNTTSSRKHSWVYSLGKVWINDIFPIVKER